MKDRTEALIKALGVENDDLGYVLWNTSPGAVVLIEKLAARVTDLERAADAAGQAVPKDLPTVRVKPKENVPENA